MAVDTNNDPPTVASATKVTASGGNVEATVSNMTGTPNPDIAVKRTLPLGDGVVIPAGVPLSDHYQHGAVPVRGLLDVIAARPQNPPAMRAYTKSFATHTPVSSAGLDAAALSVDIGSDWRFLVTPGTLSGHALQTEGVPGGNTGWFPSQGSETDHSNIALDVVNLSAQPPFPSNDQLNFYYSRLGKIIRSNIDAPGCALMLKVRTNATTGLPVYTGSNPLVTQFTNAFTCAIVADIDDPPWAFCDLASTYSAKALTPSAATTCTLRLFGDRLMVYANGHRCFDQIISDVAEGPNQPLTLETRRPTIIIWSMDALNGVGCLVVVTPKRIWSADLTFRTAQQIAGPSVSLPGHGAWDLSSSNYYYAKNVLHITSGIGSPIGAQNFFGGFTFGYANFESGQGFENTIESNFLGNAAVWSPYELSVWHTAMTSDNALNVATLLDNVYGVHR